MNQIKIAIVGAGAVGTTAAYALMLTNTPADILLVDVDETRCTGEIMDLQDAAPLCHTRNIISTTLNALQKADIIIIAAGKRQEPGQSRTQLVDTNKAVINSIFERAGNLKPSALIIMVSNPLDILTNHAQKLSGLPHNQVFGTGTFLDSLRMRQLVAQEVGVDTASINAYILGEHGDCQFPAWSCAEIGGKPITAFDQLSAKKLSSITQKTRDKAYEIIACKGSTFYGIATCIARICQAILSDEHLVIPLSCYQEEFGIYLSMPAVLAKQGILKVIDIPLDEHETTQLHQCAKELKKFL